MTLQDMVARELARLAAKAPPMPGDLDVAALEAKVRAELGRK